MYLLVCCVALPGRALVNGEAPAEADTRFDAVGAFGHTARLNVRQGNAAEHQWYGAAVLVAPDVVLTAKHLLPNGANNLPEPGAMTVRFRRHPDGSVGSNDDGVASYHQATIARFVLCPDADLMLCILTEPVEHIEPVTIDLSEDTFDETPVLLAGWGSTSHWMGQGGPRTQLRFGGHTAAVRGGIVRLASYDTENRERDNGGAKAYVVDTNTVPNMFDSGGSVFIADEEGEIRLVGIIASYRNSTWVGRYIDDDAFPLRAATRGSDALLAALGAD